MNYESLLSNLWYGLVILTSVTKLLKTEMNYISLKHLLFILVLQTRNSCTTSLYWLL